MDGPRRSGIDIVGDVSWGTHLCQFYQNGEDLLDILVPYFKAGLENNEFCMWVTSQPVGEVDARQALKRAMPDLDRYVERGQIEIMPHSNWYLKGGYFDLQRVLDGWIDKLDKALAAGYDGIRVTGNTAWLEKRDWRDFTEYEAAIDGVMGRYRMMAICTYHLDLCGASEIADVISNHQFALIKRHGGWETIESAERRRMEAALVESEAKYRLLFENMPEGLAYHRVLYDEENRPIDYVFLEANEAFERQTGLKREAIIGRRVTEVLPGIEKSEFDWIGTYGRIARTGKAIRFEQHSEVLGRWYYVSAYSPIKEHFVAVFTDITEQVSARRRIEELAAEAQRQALAAEHRAAELDVANKELEAFSYTVSHDLRAPLRGIDGLSVALLEDYFDKLDDPGKNYLRQVRKESQRMGQLIDDILRLSRITRQEMARAQVDLSRLALEVVAELRQRQPDRRVEFVVAPGLKEDGDVRLLRVALENLLENAWKFTTRREVAKIEIGSTLRGDKKVYFIRDNGSGFDMEYSDKLFGAFQRLHSADDFPGSGIGLATVQRIIRRHGGQVWAEGAVEQGATFYFTLSG